MNIRILLFTLGRARGVESDYSIPNKSGQTGFFPITISKSAYEGTRGTAHNNNANQNGRRCLSINYSFLFFFSLDRGEELRRIITVREALFGRTESLLPASSSELKGGRGGAALSARPWRGGCYPHHLVRWRGILAPRAGCVGPLGAVRFQMRGWHSRSACDAKNTFVSSMGRQRYRGGTA